MEGWNELTLLQTLLMSHSNTNSGSVVLVAILNTKCGAFILYASMYFVCTTSMYRIQ